MIDVDWAGVFPAATTQFLPDQSLDIAGTLAHLDAMIEAGIHGLIMLGTVGENCSLEYPEKLELLQATVRHVAGRVPLLSGGPCLQQYERAGRDGEKVTERRWRVGASKRLLQRGVEDGLPRAVARRGRHTDLARVGARVDHEAEGHVVAAGAVPTGLDRPVEPKL